MTEITIVLPLPSPVLSPNPRPHWRLKAKVTKKHRNDAWLAALVELDGQPRPLWEQAKISAVWFRKTDLPQYSMDQDNATARLKSYCDGLQGSILENDRGLEWATHEFRVDKTDPRIELTIRSLDSELET